MKRQTLQAFAGLLFLFAVVTATLFLSAWTLDYWQAWAFLAVFFGSSLAITIYLIQNDPKLLDRRVAAGPLNEKTTSQKIIQSFASMAFLLVIAFPVFDRRFAWSSTSPAVNVVGDFLIAIGFYVVFLVFKTNTFASALIDVESDQQVVTTGPYALVRHPMYAGALILLLGVPLALGSWWGVFSAIPITAVIVWRLFDEEKFLAQNLPGYMEYCAKVHWRLMPGIF
jgi:protein-S-isoprenylcysteine O-methyltransferase Ste14